MGLKDYANFLALNESVQGDITLPALTRMNVGGKSFSYQDAINRSSGGEKTTLENEALFLQSVIETRGSNIKIGTLGEYMTAAVFGGKQTNNAGESNTIFYDVVIGNSYYSVKTSFGKDSNTPGSCLGSSRLKRNNILSIFSSAGANLQSIDDTSAPKYAMDLYEMCEGRKKLDGGNDKFGFSLVYIRDKKFQLFLTDAVTKNHLLDVITTLWNKEKKKIKEEIKEDNVISLFLDAVIPADKNGRVSGSWSPANIISYFGGEEAASTIDIEVVSSVDRKKLLAFVSHLDTDVLLNFAQTQGYKE